MNKQTDFIQTKLRTCAEDVLTAAKRAGADSAELYVSEEVGFSVEARNADVETLEHHQEKGLSLTVYVGQKTATASTSDLSTTALHATVEKALSIARFANEDPFAGLPDPARLAAHPPDCQLYHPWEITIDDAIKKAIDCEAVACAQDPRIKQSEGASVCTYARHRVLANSDGFMGGYASSYHQISCSMLAEENGHMQRDDDYTIARRPEALEDVVLVGKRAAEKAVKRLNAKKIKTQQVPVIFHADVAKSLLRAFTGAISGGNLYRKSTFLLDALHQPIFPAHIHIYQEPHLLSALGTAPFDSEGVATKDLHFVRDGILESHVLNSYYARALNTETTGNCGGVRNLSITHSDMNLHELLKKMGTGLLITECIGQGVNITTGDFSRGICGFWVENGELVHPVEEVTVAGNLKDMFKRIVAVGNDVDTRGNIRTGSILLESMMIAGM